MELFYRKSGTGSPLIILHGLYGSSDNWYSIARELASSHTVYVVDQRNHGQSPHYPDHNYEVLREDLHTFMLTHEIDRAVILGHSMGGKTALAFGLKYPEKVSKMVVVDISPFGYMASSQSPESTIHERIIHALQTLIPGKISSREEADKLLQKSIAPPSVRHFLLKNLKRSPGGNYFWALNIAAIANNMPAIFASVLPENNPDQVALSGFPLLFIRGEYSGYLRAPDIERISRLFPQALFITVAGAGHWVHAEQPAAFLAAVRNFVQDV